MPYERLNAQDATLYCAEAPAAPLQVGALCLFEAGPLLDATGCLRIDDLRGHIESRLSGSPRFRQKLVTIPFGQGRPVWVDDPRFDIAYHVHAAALPRPGGPAELRRFMTELLEEPLDRDRPLWEIWCVEGVEGDRVAVVPKVNHVMADGIAVLQSALSVLDLRRDVPAETPEPWVPGSAPSGCRLLVDAVLDQTRRRAALGCRAAMALGNPRRLLGGIGTAVRAVTQTTVRAPALPFTRPVGPRRDFTWVRLPFEDLRAVARAEGVTVNDAVLAVVAGALGRYLGQGSARATIRPRVLVPVSTHVGAGEIENLFSMMVADLPLAAPDPLSRLRATHREMAARKASGQATLGPQLFKVGELVPPWLLHLVAEAALPRQPFVNLAVTNLPGANAPAYLLGSRMLELFPFVTVTGNLALIIGVLSYNGSLGVGLTADADAVGDLDRLAAAIEAAASELIASGRGASVRAIGPHHPRGTRVATRPDTTATGRMAGTSLTPEPATASA